MTRRLMTHCIIFGWLFVLLAGCVPLQPTGARPAGGEPITVQFSLFGGPADQAVYQAVVDAFHAKAVSVDGAPVRVELLGIPSAGDYMTRLTMDFAAGMPPDVFMLNYRRMTQFYNSGAMEPLGPWLTKSAALEEEDLYDVALDAFRDREGSI